MNSRIVGLRVASAVFGIVFLGQVGRLLMRLEVNVGGHSIPLWCSGVVLVVVGLLSFWLWWLTREPKSAAGAPTPS